MLEIILRLCADGWTWIFVKLHFMEIVLIVFSATQIFLINQLGESVETLRQISILRILRFAHGASIIGRLPWCTEVHLLSRGMSTCLPTLMWSSLLLFSLTFVFSLITTEFIAYGSGFEEIEWVGEYFGSVARSMFTLFQVTTLDRWTSIARPLMESESWVAPFFILFISLSNWVVLSLLVAVLVDGVLRVSRGDETDRDIKTQEFKKQQAAHLQELFSELDQDGNMTISLAEWQVARRHPKIATMLHKLNINQSEMDDLWAVMDNGNEEIEIDKFVETISRWKVKPTMADLMVCLKQIRNCDEQLETSDKRIGDIQTEIGTLKEALRDIHRQQAVLLRVCKKLEVSGSRPQMDAIVLA